MMHDRIFKKKFIITSNLIRFIYLQGAEQYKKLNKISWMLCVQLSLAYLERYLIKDSDISISFVLP